MSNSTGGIIMSERMLVTQALDERDLLVKKINDKIQKASFVDTIKPNVELVYNKRIKKEEFNQAASSAYQLFFVKHFSLKKASEFPVFSEGFSLL